MPSPMQREFGLRSHLIAFAIAVVLPITILAGVLLARSAASERAELEARLVQVADDLAEDLDRELSNLVTTLRTLATSPALQADDLAAFHAQATAAVQGWGAVFLVDPTSLHQVLNTLVPWGTPLPKTGDAETVIRVRETGQPQVSDHFVGVVSQRPTFNVDIPIMRGGKLRYVMLLGLDPQHLLPVLEGQKLDAEWVSSIVDRKGILLARTRGQAQFAGRAYPALASDQAVLSRGIVTGHDLEGQKVLRAVVRSKVSGWLATASLPVSVAEAPLSRSLQQWATASAVALGIALVAAWWFGRTMERPMRVASQSAAALGRGEPIAPLHSSLAEANSIVAALQSAGAELSRRAGHQDMLMHELSHRVKNVLSVVQSLVQRTLSEERPLPETRDALMQRLRALARAHDLLVNSEWRGAALTDIVAAELAPFAGRAHVSGPDVTVHAGMVQTFALLLHELATNAAKHGSLSVDQGTVSIAWSVTGSGKDARFNLHWKETGGPTVKPPASKGFGSTLLENALSTSAEMKSQLSFQPQGLEYELHAPLDAIGARA